MKPNAFSRLVRTGSPTARVLAAAIASLLAGSAAHATSDSWKASVDGNWADSANWTNANIPGSTTLDNNNIATFSFTLTGSGKTVTVDTDRYIGGISFGNTSTFGYTLAGGILHLNNGGVIQTLAANGNHADTISSAIVLDGDGGAAAFRAGALSATSILNLGAITGIATGSNVTTLTLTGVNTGANAVTGIIVDGTGGGKLAVVKNSIGTWTLSNANTYTGTTSVTDGLLRINGNHSAATGAVGVTGGAIGGTGTVGGAVTVSGTGGINLLDGTVGSLTLGSTLDITGAAGANNLCFNLGAAAAGTDMIIVAGATTVSNTGAVVINLNQIGGAATRINAGTHTLIQGTGSMAALGQFTLPTTAAFGSNFTLGVTGNDLQVTTTLAAAGPAAAFWAGGGDNWSTAANWNTSATSGTSSGAPGYQTNVTFNTTSPAAVNLGSNLIDVDVDINSLKFDTTATTPATIGGTKMLTIEATNANANTAGNGITNSTASGVHTISAQVGLASNQTWTVATGGTLAVSGAISNFGGGYALTKAGAGNLTLSGANTYNGATTITGGTLALSGGDNRLPNTGTLAFNGTTTILDLGGTSQTLSSITYGTANPQTNTIQGGGSLILNGPSDFLVGLPINAATATLTASMAGVANFTYNSSSNKFSVGGRALTKSGTAGSTTLTLANNNSITASQFIVNETSNSGDGNAGAVYLGQTNIINADIHKVGAVKGVATLSFKAGLTDPSLTIRGTAGGTTRTTLSIGIDNSGTTAGTGTLDLTTGVTGTSTLDAMIGTLTIGWNTRTSSEGGAATGTFNMGGGTLDATTIILGQNNTTGSAATGTLSVTGGTVRAGTLTLGERVGTNAVTGTFNLNSGTLCATTVKPGTGTATRNFNWTTGSIRNYDASTDLTIATGLSLNLIAGSDHTFNIDASRTATVNAVISSTGTGNLVKDGNGTLSLTATNTYTGDTTVTAGILAVNGSSIADTNKLIITGGKVEATGTEIVDTLFFGATQQAAGNWSATAGAGVDFVDPVHFAGTGIVSVTTGPVGGYNTWATANAGGQAADLDYDMDGVPNGVEYFMGQTGSTFTPNPSVVGNKITWPYDATTTGITYQVKSSTDLSSWVPVSPQPVPTGGTLEYILPTSGPTLFVRLEVVVAAP
jgi:autotransporter-associated beta strand protein